MQTSAKDDINVTEAMNMLLREVVILVRHIFRGGTNETTIDFLLQIADKDITEPGSPTDQDSIVLEPEKKKKTCLC